MVQITTGIRAVLSYPRVYSLFQALMGARSGWIHIVQNRVRPRPGDKILDLGCGPADLLGYLPAVQYWGYDISEAYIAQARRKYGDRGQLHCKLLTPSDLVALPRFDVVIASGLLHHLEDSEASELIDLAHTALAPGGRLVTIDPCLVPGQNSIARFLITRDRGRNVRSETGYRDLVTGIFDQVSVSIEHKAWIPYTHCFTECTKT